MTLPNIDRTFTATATVPHRLFWAGLLCCAVLLAANAATFLPYQSLWVDETTQLSGIALGPGRLLPWLTGAGPDLGVPPDRTPPGSYLLAMAWSAVVGFSEVSLRWFGLCCAVIGLALTSLAARRAFGVPAALAAGLYLALSPNVLVYAVEIRAYPVFLMWTGWALYLFVGALQAEASARSGRIGWLIVALLGAAYTHFFGLVFACALLTALFIELVRRRQPVAPLLGWSAVFLVACAGLWPFVRASLAMSSGTPSGAGHSLMASVRDLSKLVYRQYGHPGLANSTVAMGLASAGFALALLAAVFAGPRRDTSRNGLAWLCGVGFLVVACAASVVKGFSPTGPHYNVWLLSSLAVLLSRAVVSPPGWWSRIGWAGMGLLLATSAYASWHIHREPQAYAHGPQRQLLALIDQLGPEQVDVVYDIAPDGDAFGLVVFPVRYRFGRALPQYKFEAGRIVPFDVHDGVPPSPSRSHVVVVRAISVGAAELAQRLRERPPLPTELLPAAQSLTGAGWRPVSRSDHVGMVTAEFDVMQRSSP